MTEQQMVDLVDRLGEVLDPDVASIVAAGAARGRSRKRRQRLGVGLGVAAAAVVVGAAVPLLGGGSSAGPGPATEPEPVPWHLAVAPGDMSTTLAGLLPGSTVVDSGFTFQQPQGRVRWHGVEVTLQVDERSLGIATSPRERCAGYAGGSECEAAPGGAWFRVGAEIDVAQIQPDGELGTEHRTDEVRAYLPGGYVVTSSADHDAGLGTDRLRDIALDPAWWD